MKICKERTLKKINVDETDLIVYIVECKEIDLPEPEFDELIDIIDIYLAPEFYYYTYNDLIGFSVDIVLKGIDEIFKEVDKDTQNKLKLLKSKIKKYKGYHLVEKDEEKNLKGGSD